MRMLLFGLIPLVHGAAASPLLAQDRRAEPVLAWATVGLGGGTEGFAGAVGFDVLIQQHLISLRAAAVANILDDEFRDFAVLYGRASRWSRGLVGASMGLAVMDGERCSGLGACAPVAARISLPVAVRAAWHALPFLGLGAYGFANVNGEQSFAGVTLAVELGRFR